VIVVSVYRVDLTGPFYLQRTQVLSSPRMVEFDIDKFRWMKRKQEVE
jgi:hypothetical protein